VRPGSGAAVRSSVDLPSAGRPASGRTPGPRPARTAYPGDADAHQMVFQGDVIDEALLFGLPAPFRMLGLSVVETADGCQPVAGAPRRPASAARVDADGYAACLPTPVSGRTRRCRPQQQPSVNRIRTCRPKLPAHAHTLASGAALAASDPQLLPSSAHPSPRFQGHRRQFRRGQRSPVVPRHLTETGPLHPVLASLDGAVARPRRRRRRRARGARRSGARRVPSFRRRPVPRRRRGLRRRLRGRCATSRARPGSAGAGRRASAGR
jgi:hypothetical protein